MTCAYRVQELLVRTLLNAVQGYRLTALCALVVAQPIIVNDSTISSKISPQQISHTNTLHMSNYNCYRPLFINCKVEIRSRIRHYPRIESKLWGMGMIKLEASICIRFLVVRNGSDSSTSQCYPVEPNGLLSKYLMSNSNCRLSNMLKMIKMLLNYCSI